MTGDCRGGGGIRLCLCQVDTGVVLSMDTRHVLTSLTFRPVAAMHWSRPRVRAAGGRLGRCTLVSSVADRVHGQPAPSTTSTVEAADWSAVERSSRRHDASFIGADLRGSYLSALDPLNAKIKDAIIDVEQAMVIATALGLRLGG